MNDAPNEINEIMQIKLHIFDVYKRELSLPKDTLWLILN